MSVYYDRTAMVYINFELTVLVKEEQDKMINNIDYSTMNGDVNNLFLFAVNL
jgi:hypothetical protein